MQGTYKVGPMGVNDLMKLFQSNGKIQWTVNTENPTSYSLKHFNKHMRGIKFKVIQIMGINELQILGLQEKVKRFDRRWLTPKFVGCRFK